MDNIPSFTGMEILARYEGCEIQGFLFPGFDNESGTGGMVPVGI
jgi:hypothetical protein